MATAKQIQANRNNAKKSTGPRTEVGKARVSQNALKHGLLARDAVLPGEDRAEFEAQLAALEADIQPGDALERELVRQIADAQWRLRRLTRLETAYLAASLDNTRRLSAAERAQNAPSDYDADTLLLGYSLFHSTQVLAHFARYDAHLSRRFERAIQQIARLRDAREKRLQQTTNPTRPTAAHPANVYPTQPNPAATLHPASSLSAQLQETEYNRTNPISSNQNRINDLTVAGHQLFRAPSDPRLDLPEHHRAASPKVQPNVPGHEAGDLHGSLPG